MNLTVEGQLLTIEVPHSMTPTMKTIPGARYDKKRRVWTMPFNLQAYAALGQYHQEPDDHWAHMMVHFINGQELRRNKTTPIKNHEHLYPFQAAGVRFLAGGKGVLMADEMGTGKTVQSLTAIELEQAYPALVVCPNSLKHNWAKEVRQWTSADPIVIEGDPRKRRILMEQIKEAAEHWETPVVAIINYESLLKHTKQAPFGNTVLTAEKKQEKELNEIPWTTVVVDEAHRIKSPKANATRAVWGVAEGARYRFALTGTPIVNNPDDLWSIMRFVAPSEYPSRQRFRERYCFVRPGWHGGLENMGLREDARPEFDILTQPRFIRRTKAEVLPDLPEKILTTRHLPLRPKQQKAYDQMVEYLMAEVRGGILTATDPLVLVGRLRYIACAEPVVNEDYQVVALEGQSNKLDEVRSILEETEDQLVVYAASRKLIEFFERDLSNNYSVSTLTGTATPAQRQLAIDQFQAGDTKVFLATTGAGAEGLTLTSANRMVIAMEDWSNVKNKQAHDRIHRIGQERGVEIITLVSEGTIEEAVQGVTRSKEAQLQDLVKDEEALFRAMTGGS